MSTQTALASTRGGVRAPVRAPTPSPCRAAQRDLIRPVAAVSAHPRSVAVPTSAFPRRAPAALLAAARAGLVEAATSQRTVERYALAHLSALRCAAAVLAARARPGGARRGPTNAWTLLAVVAPELGEWAAFFAAGAVKRAAAEAGQPRVVSDREADDILRDAQIFLALVETTLGVPESLPLTGWASVAHSGAARP